MSKIPLEDRIAAIRDDAARMARQLEEHLRKVDTSPRGAAEWAVAEVGFNRRLEALAGSPEGRVEDMERLAVEAEKFYAAHRTKGLVVDQQARELARLVMLRAEQ